VKTVSGKSCKALMA